MILGGVISIEFFLEKQPIGTVLICAKHRPVVKVAENRWHNHSTGTDLTDLDWADKLTRYYEPTEWSVS